MSSFVIPKPEYIKAAGILAGITEASRRSFGREMYVYSYQHGKRLEGEEFHKVFAELYEMNSVSVAEQYGEPLDTFDNDDYRILFNEYTAKGKALYYKPSALHDVAAELNLFFQSVKYQIEKEAYYFKAMMILNDIISAMYLMIDSLEHREGRRTSWGSLDL